MEDWYIAISSFEAQQDGDLSLSEGDKVRVTDKSQDEWWQVEKKDGTETGLVPMSHIKQVIKRMVVIKDHPVQERGMLSLSKDDIVDVYEKLPPDGDEWWAGGLNGKIGIFPASHVEPVDEPNNRRSHSFKLAAFGVKPGGIGSILAGVTKKSGNQENPTPPAAPPRSRTKDTSTETIATNPPNAKQAMVVAEFKAEREDEIDLIIGELVTVTDEQDDEWWKGSNERGEEGMFPSKFVNVLNPNSPARPPRTRPATIQTNENKDKGPTSPTVGGPPPIPVSTRPMSTSSAGAPPPRPITSPPIPTRQNSTTISSAQSQRPNTAIAPALASAAPVPPPRQPKQGTNNAPTPPTRMAKVPEYFSKQARPPAPGSRPPSQGPLPEPLAMPPRPSTSVPRVPNPPSRPSNHAPELTNGAPLTVSTTASVSRPASQASPGPASPPPVPQRTMPLPPPVSMERNFSTNSDTAAGTSQCTDDGGEVPGPASDNNLEARLQDLLQREIGKIRQEFKSVLEAEKAERVRLEKEVAILKEQLQ